MCGIAGIYHLNGKTADVALLKQMTGRMLHRGPDEDGYMADGPFTMGIRRLSIIDIEGGSQPIFNEDGRFCVTLNGEIYNYVELRSDLLKRGHRFRTNSDTEVIVHLFEEKGIECLRDLNGMYAFAVWDRMKRELYVARDRMGVKPLFFSVQDRVFSFSSDLQALNAVLNTRSIDRDSFMLYFGLAYVPYPNTIFKGIQKLPPANYLKVTPDGNVRTECYWQIKEQNFLHTKEENYCEEILALLEDAVKLQLRSDVPIGTFLSGGLDSSTVVAFLSKHVSCPVRTFSLGFEGGWDELPNARRVAEKFGTDHYEAVLKLEDVSPLLEESIRYLDEPIYDNSIVPTYFLSQTAKKAGVKVILNGTGGDEIFGGYLRYRMDGLKRWNLRMPDWMRKKVGGLGAYIDRRRGEKILHPSLMFLTSGADLNFMYEAFSKKNKYESRLNLLVDHFDRNIKNYRAVSDLMHRDLKGYLVDDVLSLLDKMTMAHSIEGRVPLLDHRLVELIFSIPDKIKLKGGELKSLFRRCMKDILPPELFNTPKIGFSGPTARWVNGPLKPIIRYHLVEAPIEIIREEMNMEWLKRIICAPSVDERYCESIFALHVFTCWYKFHVLKIKAKDILVTC